MRTIIAILEVDDDKAIEEDLGTIEYIEREFGWLEQSGVFLQNARILDDDDEYDAKAIELANKIFEEDTKMKTRYYVCGLGYDVNDCITDYDFDFGDFDAYEEAYELFVKLQCKDIETFFENAPDVCRLLIQLEECEETDDEITCVDVKNEWWIDNPNF